MVISLMKIKKDSFSICKTFHLITLLILHRFQNVKQFWKRGNTWPWQERYYLSKLLFILQAWSLSCKRTFSEKKLHFCRILIQYVFTVKITHNVLWRLIKPLDQSPNHVIMLSWCHDTCSFMHTCWHCQTIFWLCMCRDANWRVSNNWQKW